MVATVCQQDVEAGSGPSALMRYAAEPETPPGYRVEVMDGRIIVTPPPDGHRANAGETSPSR